MHNTTSGEVVNDTSLFSEDLASINTKNSIAEYTHKKPNAERATKKQLLPTR